jgi:hypothetical protein
VAAAVGDASRDAHLDVTSPPACDPSSPPLAGFRRTLLLVSTYEAEQLTAEVASVIGDDGGLLPGLETLPHERLSPGRTSAAASPCCAGSWATTGSAAPRRSGTRHSVPAAGAGLAS